MRFRRRCLSPPPPPQVPCIAHQDGPDLPLLPTALTDPGLAYVAVTSPEAAKVFLAGWASAGEPPVSVACVGKATGQALRKGGVEPVFTPSKANAETLAAEIPFVGGAGAGRAQEAVTGDAESESEESETVSKSTLETIAESTELRRVLYPASAKAQKTLESGLAARGFEVRRLNTYDTVPAEWDAAAEAAAGGASVAAFGSPSAVKTWAARLGVAVEGEGGGGGARGGGGGGEGAGGALAACIGETSARACREAGWPESTIFYPEKPGMGGWAKAVEDALAAAKASSEAGAVA